MKMIDKYGSISNVHNNTSEAYTENMRTFFAVPGMSVGGGNIILNAQFDSGTTGWSSNSSSNSASSNILSNTSNGALSYNSVYQSTSYSTVVSNKIYVKTRVRVTNSDCLAFWIRVDGTITGTAVIIKSISNPDINTWYDISGILTTPVDFTGNYLVQIYHVYPSALSGKVMEIDGASNHGVLVVDLTEVFGAGNEPDVDYCDAFYEQFFTFTGTDYHGQIRVKIDCPKDADTLEIRAKNTGAWTTYDNMNTGWLCGTIDKYEAERNYAVDDWVIYSGTIYKSLLGSNTGNTPDSNPTFWVDTSDVDNNEWYTLMGTGLKNYVRAFPGKNGVFNENIYLPPDCVHGYYMDGNPYDSIGAEDGVATDVEYVNAVVGEAASFNGSSSKIDMGKLSDLTRTLKLANGVSYECWFKIRTGATNINYLMCDFDSFYGLLVYDEVNSRLQFRKYDGTTVYYAYSAIGSILEETWYHAVATIYDDQTTELFLNGVSVDTNADTSIPFDFAAYSMAIGARSSDGAGVLDGWIDQVRFYLGALTPTEVQALYENPTSTPPASCVHEYLLDGDATDNIGSANGIATDLEYVDRVLGEVGKFNGSSSMITLPNTISDFLTSSFSIEFWIKTGNISGYPMYFNYGSDTGFYNDVTKIRFFMNATFLLDSGANSITPGAWTHVVVTRDISAGIKLYLNGEEKDSDAYTGTDGSGSQYNSIGTNYNQSGGYLDADLDQIRFYSNPLTPTEITALYEDPTSTPPASCIHEYLLDGDATDNIGSANGIATDVEYVDTVLGEVGKFNGSSSYIDCGTPSDFDRAIKSANGCAYECWIYANAWGTEIGYGSKRLIYDRNGWVFLLLSDASGQITGIKATGVDYFVSKAGLSLNTWYHVVVNIYDDYKMEMFVNGVSVDSDTNTDIPLDRTDGIFIGRSSNASSYWDGLIDQVRFYNAPLTPAEITALYEDPTSTPPSSCVHEYLLDGDATDNIGSANGTDTNIEYVSAIVEEAGYFNGTSSHINCGTPADLNRATKLANGVSYECWLYANSWGTDMSSLSKRALVDRHGWLAWIGSGQSGSITATKYTGLFYPIHKTGLSLNTWYHVVFIVYTDNTSELFVNGVSAGVNNNTSIVADLPSVINIGSNAAVTGSFWDGLIDQVRFYTRPLTPTEITSLYNEGHNIGLNESNAKGGGLKTEYTFDSITGSTLEDTANSNDATNSNVVAIAGLIGNAGDYNGISSYTNIDNALSGTDVNNDFSVSFLLKNVTADIGTIISFYNTHIININLVTGRYPYMRISDGTNYTITSPDALTIGGDYMITCTRSKTSGMKIYVDAVLKDSDSFSGNASTISRQSVLAATPTGTTSLSTYMDMTFDQIRFYTRVLETYEIINLYNKGRGC